jgi:hypothetical protein
MRYDIEIEIEIDERGLEDMDEKVLLRSDSPWAEGEKSGPAAKPRS